MPVWLSAPRRDALETIVLLTCESFTSCHWHLLLQGARPAVGSRSRADSSPNHTGSWVQARPGPVAPVGTLGGPERQQAGEQRNPTSGNADEQQQGERQRQPTGAVHVADLAEVRVGRRGGARGNEDENRSQQSEGGSRPPSRCGPRSTLHCGEAP